MVPSVAAAAPPAATAPPPPAVAVPPAGPVMEEAPSCSNVAAEQV